MVSARELRQDCLVASTKHNGREILIVLLGSTQEEVFRDAKRLFRWYEKQVKAKATGDAPPARWRGSQPVMVVCAFRECTPAGVKNGSGEDADPPGSRCAILWHEASFFEA